jgi:hypothetical protein
MNLMMQKAVKDCRDRQDINRRRNRHEYAETSTLVLKKLCRFDLKNDDDQLISGSYDSSACNL